MATSRAILTLRIKHSTKSLNNITPDENIVEQNLERAAEFERAYKNRTLGSGRWFGPLMIDTADMFTAVPNAIREAAARTRSYLSYTRNPSGNPALSNAPFRWDGLISHPHLWTREIAQHKGHIPSPDVGFWDSRRSLNTPKTFI